MSNEPIIGIETFKTVTKAIAHSDHLEIMSGRLTQLLVAALDIKGCAIFILNPETDGLEILASFGLSVKYLTKGPLRMPQTLLESFKGNAQIIPDVTQGDGLQYPEAATQEGVAAIISLPIVFIEEVMGVLRLYHHKRWDISVQDLDSLHLLAANIGLAMSYARLSNAIQSIAEFVDQALPQSRG